MEEYEEVYVFAEFPELEGLDALQNPSREFQIEFDKAAQSASCSMKGLRFEGEFELNLGTMMFFNEYKALDGKIKTKFVQQSENDC